MVIPFTRTEALFGMRAVRSLFSDTVSYTKKLHGHERLFLSLEKDFHMQQNVEI